MNDKCITDEQVATLEARCEEINENTPEHWAVFYQKQDWMHVNFTIATTPTNQLLVTPGYKR
jgi:hypothetical protein